MGVGVVVRVCPSTLCPVFSRNLRCDPSAIHPEFQARMGPTRAQLEILANRHFHIDSKQKYIQTKVHLAHYSDICGSIATRIPYIQETRRH